MKSKRMLLFLKMASQHLLKEKVLLQPIAIPLTHHQMLPRLGNASLPRLVPLMQNQFLADESKSPPGSPSPGRPTTFESPSREYSEDHFRKSSDGDAENHRGFDEPSWGDFDNNDDIDSVWGFNTKRVPSLRVTYSLRLLPPAPPLSRAGRDSNDAGDLFNRYSRYDSFSTNNHVSSPRGENFTRFDSISSSRSFKPSTTVAIICLTTARTLIPSDLVDR